MRNDDQNHPGRGGGPATGRPETARPRSRAASTAVLSLLTAGTSWAVASWVSAWLVPPYLILMAWILLPDAGRPRGDPAGDGPDRAEVPEPARPVEGPVDRADPGEAPASAGAPEGSETAAADPPTRGRRGKGKARKARATPEPGEATWVEVGPGKFVRVEAPRSRAEAGPHDFMGVPVGVAATPDWPQADEAAAGGRAEVPGPVEAPRGVEAVPGPEAPPEASGPVAGPAEDAAPAFDSIEGPGGDPAGESVESGSPTMSEPGEGIESPGSAEDLPAVDGIAPQAGESAEGPEADRTVAEPERIVEGPGPGVAPAPDRLGPGPPAESTDLAREAVAEADPSFQDSTGPEAEPTSRAETPEAEAPGRSEVLEEWGAGCWDEAAGAIDDPEPATPADLAPEFAEEWIPTEMGGDPTETAVDETVLDDAASPEADFDAPGTPPADDLPEPDAPPGVPEGSEWWPRRLAPRARTRAGFDPRATSNAAPPRRPVRSRGPSRRPPDPRRLTRRGAARPRQITRTFPPRSPPCRMPAGD